MPTRIFIDTSYVQALIDRRDKYHSKALSIIPTVNSATRCWITEAVLIEIANALCSTNRLGAMQYLRLCQAEPRLTVLKSDSETFESAVLLYGKRMDKTMGPYRLHLLRRHGA